MSILEGKHVLVIGEETEQISKVEAALITYGATITTSACETTTVDSIVSQCVDLVLINHMHDGVHCRHLLEKLTNDGLLNIPVFALVQNDQVHIKEAFVLGASDFITPYEDVHTVVEKMRSLLGGAGDQTKNSAIDITPKSVDTKSGTRVFAIEDDPLLRNLLSVRFEKAGLPFAIAEDGIDIIDKLKEFQPQIIILDLKLPKKDGFEVLQEIKNSSVKDVPVVIFSNNDSPSDREQAKNLGAVAFFVKALTDLSEMVQVIEKFAKK